MTTCRSPKCAGKPEHPAELLFVRSPRDVLPLCADAAVSMSIAELAKGEMIKESSHADR